MERDSPFESAGTLGRAPLNTAASCSYGRQIIRPQRLEFVHDALQSRGQKKKKVERWPCTRFCEDENGGLRRKIRDLRTGLYLA